MSNSAATSMAALFARLFWMVIGPLALLVTLYDIVSSGAGWSTPADLVYFVILTGMLLGRYAEFRAGHATRSDGEPATAADLRRYVLLTAALGPAAWVAANVLGIWLQAR